MKEGWNGMRQQMAKSDWTQLNVPKSMTTKKEQEKKGHIGIVKGVISY